jgi:hypothetical protein
LHANTRWDILARLYALSKERDEAWDELFDSFWKEMQYESEVASYYRGVVSEEALRYVRDAAANLKEAMSQKIDELSDEI